jgi:O-antigen/teichoic acid export membrane protein
MIRSVIYNWLGLLVAGLVSFLLTPVLIRSLGVYYYGLWMLVGSLTDYYGLLDVGIRVTLQRFVARQSGTQERDALDQTFSTAMALTWIISLVIVVGAVLLAFVLPGFFSLHGEARAIFQVLMLLFGAQVALTLIARLYGAYLCGIHRFDLYNLGGIVTAILRAAALVLVLWQGRGVVAVAVVSLAVAAVSALMHHGITRRADPALRIDVRSTTLGRVKELVSFSFYIFLNTIGDYLRGYTDSLVIGHWIGIAAITPFSVVVRLMEYFKQLMTGVIGPVMPAISQLDAQHRDDDVRRLFLRTTRVTALISLLVGAEFMLHGRSLLRYWVGESFVSSFGLLFVMAAGYVVNFAQSPGVVLLVAKGKHKELGWWTLAEGAANLGLSIYWAKEYGLIGVAWGTVVPMVANKLVVLPILVVRHSTIRIREYLLQGFGRPLLAATAFFVFSILTQRYFAVDTRALFFLKALGDAALFSVIGFWAGLERSDRQGLMSRILPARLEA